MALIEIFYIAVNFNPQRTPVIPAVKMFAVLDFLNLDEKSWFPLGH